MLLKGCASVLCCVVVLTSCLFTIGCSSSQFDSALSTVSSELPAAVALAGDVGTLVGSAKLGPEFVKFSAAAAADLPAVKAAIGAYQSNKTAGAKQAIFAAVNVLVAEVNANFLAANTVSNQQSQQAVLQKMAAFSAVVNAFQLALAPFFNSTAKAKGDFRQVQPYIARGEQEQAAAVYGYSLEDLGL